MTYEIQTGIYFYKLRPNMPANADKCTTKFGYEGTIHNKVFASTFIFRKSLNTITAIYIHPLHPTTSVNEHNCTQKVQDLKT